LQKILSLPDAGTELACKKLKSAGAAAGIGYMTADNYLATPADPKPPVVTGVR